MWSASRRTSRTMQPDQRSSRAKRQTSARSRLAREMAPWPSHVPAPPTVRTCSKCDNRRAMILISVHTNKQSSSGVLRNLPYTTYYSYKHCCYCCIVCVTARARRERLLAWSLRRERRVPNKKQMMKNPPIFFRRQRERRSFEVRPDSSSYYSYNINILILME